MATRFVEADEELIELLSETSKLGSEIKNTKRNTYYWTGIYQKWAKTRGKEEQPESNKIAELNHALSQFYADLRKESYKTTSQTQ